MSRRITRYSLLTISIATLCSAQIAQAETYSSLFSGVLNSTGNGSGIACTECHDSSLVGADRKSAPVAANFDEYEASATRVATMISYTDTNWAGTGESYMPMDPDDPSDFIYVGVASISGTNRNRLITWQSQGTPESAATATTNTEMLVNQTTATLRGTVDTNTTNPNATASMDGQHWFRWRQGTSGSDDGCVTTTSDGWNVVDLTTRNSVSGALVTENIAVACTNDYQYRVCAKNGNNTATGSVETISFSCTAPVISQGVSTSQSVSEGSSMTFGLNVIEDDAGTLT